MRSLTKRPSIPSNWPVAILPVAGKSVVLLSCDWSQIEDFFSSKSHQTNLRNLLLAKWSSLFVLIKWKRTLFLGHVTIFSWPTSYRPRIIARISMTQSGRYQPISVLFLNLGLIIKTSLSGWCHFHGIFASWHRLNTVLISAKTNKNQKMPITRYNNLRPQIPQINLIDLSPQTH